MFKYSEGSTSGLLRLCAAYFLFYVLTGISVKYFTSPEFGAMNGTEFLVYSTIGANAICLVVVLLFRWFRIKSNKTVNVLSLNIPSELVYIIPSGIFTAVVIPTTTLMYTLPISVMVAMVIMRSSVIVISRVVDAIQIKQGVLKRKVYREENIAVVFALLAAGINIFWVGEGDFEFVESFAAVVILLSYIVAYSFRIYIMNYYKNTRGPGVKLDNKGFFAIEQITATTVLVAATLIVIFSSSLDARQITVFRDSFTGPHPLWKDGILAGLAYGMVAFFSVFIFMYKGRTATFAGLVNRLTSLVAGTAATLIFALRYGGNYPKKQDWISLLFIFIAVGFLSLSERKRRTELQSDPKGA